MLITANGWMILSSFLVLMITLSREGMKYNFSAFKIIWRCNKVPVSAKAYLLDQVLSKSTRLHGSNHFQYKHSSHTSEWFILLGPSQSVIRWKQIQFAARLIRSNSKKPNTFAHIGNHFSILFWFNHLILILYSFFHILATKIKHDQIYTKW